MSSIREALRSAPVINVVAGLHLLGVGDRWATCGTRRVWQSWWKP